MSRLKMSLICKTLAGSQLNWHRKEKKNKKKTAHSQGLIRSLVAWSWGQWIMWSLSVPNSLDPEDHEKNMLRQDRRREGDNFSRWKIICSELGEREQQTQTDRRVEGGENIIYTSVTLKPADEKSHRVRSGLDTHPRMLQIIVWLMWLLDQHF